MIQGDSPDMAQAHPRPSAGGQQRPGKVHHCHGPHRQPELGHREFFINVKDRDNLNSPSLMATVTPCSARWWAAPRWSTRSRPVATGNKGIHQERARHPRHHLDTLVKWTPPSARNHPRTATLSPNCTSLTTASSTLELDQEKAPVGRLRQLREGPL